MDNWAGNLTYHTSRLKKVNSLLEAREWIEQQPKCKVLGTRHCFNDIADTSGSFLSLEGMDKVVALDNQTVTVEAGMRYGNLAVFLEQEGYALRNLASLPHISIAGGCATATHGSGMGLGNLATEVRGMEVITAAGAVVNISDPGAVVHLGGIGVVWRLTLAIEPTYNVSQYVFEDMSMGVLEGHFGEIMSAGYSVSLFTDWDIIRQVWVKVRGGTFGPMPEFFGARAAARDLHPIEGMSAENSTPQMGIPGPWYERLPHFKMDFTPSQGRELQSEYFVPIEYAYSAIMAVARIRQLITPHLLISEIRCVAADDLWMSPCNGESCVALHFTWKPEWEAVREVLPLIERNLAPFRARPHWGKLFTMTHAQLASLYPRMKDFQELLRYYDPEGKFRNAWLGRIIFGP
jgi:xylitol oxidase